VYYKTMIYVEPCYQCAHAMWTSQLREMTWRRQYCGHVRTDV